MEKGCNEITGCIADTLSRNYKGEGCEMNDDWLNVSNSYLGKSILDHRLISERYFFPRNNRFSEPFKVRIGDIALGCYYRPYPEADNTIIHFHGNGETVKEYLDSPLLKLPYNFLFAEYRGYGMSNGEPSLVSMLQDVKTIIDSLDVPKEKIVLFGRSIGSIYALHGASLYPDSIGGLIIESGIADVRERILMRVTPQEMGATKESFDTECHTYFDHGVSAYKGIFIPMRFKVSLNSFYKPLQIVFPFQKQSAIPIRLLSLPYRIHPQLVFL
jgi:pimeloyl-ACP methyl ester carboxylesterase